MSAPDRSRLSYKLSFALRNPGRVLPYARRRSRDALIGMKASDHISYYRAVMKANTARNLEEAVGSKTHDSWLKVGQLQFDYLVKHGLQPGDRMLEIGCGDLRAGRLFIAYLNPGNYYGIDISPDILLAAHEIIDRDDLQAKLPSPGAGRRPSVPVPAVRAVHRGARAQRVQPLADRGDQ